MRAQILTLRALGEAYRNEATHAAEADNGTASVLRAHSRAHLAAADAVEAKHRSDLARLASPSAADVAEPRPAEGPSA